MPLGFPDHNVPHAVAVGIHCTAQRIEQHRQVLDLVQHQALTLTGIELKPGVFGKKGAGGRVFQIKIGVSRKHLTYAQNQHEGKRTGQVAQAFGTEAGVL